MASVFGMNAFEFGQGTVKLAHEFKYMCKLSPGKGFWFVKLI
jgi:hypothetical protein